MMVKFWEEQKKPCIILDLNNHPSFALFKTLTIDDIVSFSTRRHIGKPYYVFRPDISFRRKKDSVLEFCHVVNLYVRNSVVIFDDFTSYLEGNVHPIIEDLILNARNACNDCIFNVHSFSDVGPFALRHCEFYLIRHTVDSVTKPPNKIPEGILPLVKKMMEEIQRENRKLQDDEPRLAYRMINREKGKVIK